MIEQVVNSILEAEDVAAQRIAEAKAQAGDIVATAEQNADNFKKQQSAQNKQTYADKVRQIDETSAKKAQSRLAEQNAETDKQIALCEKNIDQAVKIILESF